MGVNRLQTQARAAEAGSFEIRGAVEFELSPKLFLVSSRVLASSMLDIPMLDTGPLETVLRPHPKSKNVVNRSSC